MIEDRKAVVKIHDLSCIDVFIDHESWMKLTKLGKVNFDGVAFRSKFLYPNDCDEE